MRDTITERCEAKGLRMTDQRRTIATVLETSDDHPDVEELYGRASGVDPRMAHLSAPSLVGAAAAACTA